MDNDISFKHGFNRIGIMGGTFNPIHCGHLIIAEDVREKFRLEKVLFIPSGQPPHKSDCAVIDAEKRYEMVRRAVASNRNFEASRIEIDRGGFTYTVNTLQELAAEYGSNTEFFFIIGADIVPELTTWKDYRTVFRLCKFIAVPRPGHDMAALTAGINRVSTEHGAEIHIANTHIVDISSTDIRERCARGESIKYLVPEEVEKYIVSEKLYMK